MADSGSTSSRDSGDSGRPPAGPAPVWTVGAGRSQVRAELRAQGPDLLLAITGGQAHVGAVAVCGTGLDGGRVDRLVEVPGHKEGPLAGEAARRLHRISGRTCVVLAGIHQDRASAEEIDVIVDNVRRLIAEVADHVSGS